MVTQNIFVIADCQLVNHDFRELDKIARKKSVIDYSEVNSISSFSSFNSIGTYISRTKVLVNVLFNLTTEILYRNKDRNVFYWANLEKKKGRM